MAGGKFAPWVQTTVVGLAATLFATAVTYWVFVPRVTSDLKSVVSDLSVNVAQFGSVAVKAMEANKEAVETNKQTAELLNALELRVSKNETATAVNAALAMERHKTQDN
jgi:hypothetical protein